MKNRKERSLIVIIVLLIISNVLILSCYFYKINHLETEKNQYKNGLISYKNLNSLTVNSFVKRISRKKDITFAYIGNRECSDCSFFFPQLLNTLKKTKLQNNIFYINVEYLHKNQNRWYKFKKKYQFDQTPCLMIFKNGKRIAKLEWNPRTGIPKNKMYSWLEKYRLLIEKSF